jgi:hypothetical protein
LQEEKDKRFGIAEHITLGTWNIWGLTQTGWTSRGTRI